MTNLLERKPLKKNGITAFHTSPAFVHPATQYTSPESLVPTLDQSSLGISEKRGQNFPGHLSMIFCIYVIAGILGMTSGVTGENPSVHSKNVVAAPLDMPPVNPLTATCNEGDFLHIQSDRCIPLHTTYGFDNFPEPANEIRLQSCALEELLEAVSVGNRKIFLPDGCTYELGRRDLSLSSNTIIEGAGVDRSLFTCTGTTAFRIHDVSNVIVRNLTVDGLNNQRENRGCGTLVFIDRGADNVLVERLRLRNALGKAVGFRTASRVTVRYSWIEDIWENHGLNADRHFVDIAYYSNYITNVGQSEEHIGYGINSHAAKAEIAGNYVEETDSGVKLMGARYTLFHHNTIIGASSTNPLYRGVWTAVDEQDNVKPVGLIYYANFVDTGGVRPFTIRDGATEIYFGGNIYGNVSHQIPISQGSNVYRCADSTDAILTGDLIQIESRLISLPDSGMGEFDPCALNRSTLSANLNEQPPVIRNQPTNQDIIEGTRTTLTVKAEGSGILTYQWQRRWRSGEWYNIYKATEPSYITWPLRHYNHGNQYRIKIGNEFGEVFSNVVTLSVYPEEACLHTGKEWQSRSIHKQQETFQATFSAIPTANKIDALVGLSRGESRAFTDMAVIIRFAENGYLDIRNGPNYMAEKRVAYQSGERYNFRVAIDIPQKSYTVYVTLPDGEEVRLARDYTFRSEQNQVTQLNAWSIWSGVGHLEVCTLSHPANKD
ncbi:MAG: hypothetical protein AAF702_40350 [Chloroflexota bacterium]